MGLTIQHDGPIRIVSFNVENLDFMQAKKCKEQLFGLIEKGLPVVIDLQGVKFVDSSGLGVISSLFRRAGSEKLCLANVSPGLEAILASLPVDVLPPCHRGVREAVAAMPGY
jgi:anti-sigma B factor antagonist